MAKPNRFGLVATLFLVTALTRVPFFSIKPVKGATTTVPARARGIS